MRGVRGAVAAVVLAAGCYAPKVHPGGACATDGSCPEGLWCDPKTTTCELAPGTYPDAPVRADADPRPDACVPAAEICDHLDQNCDGRIDEDFPIDAPCTVGVGACAVAGTYQCDLDTGEAQCVATAGDPAREICGNGVDEDCDGADAPCPPNDEAGGAIDVSAGGTFTVDLAAAHDDASGGGCGLPGGRDVFYEVTVPADEVVYFDTFGSNFPTALRVYADGCGAMSARLACSTTECGGTRSQAALVLAAGAHCVIVDQAAGDIETDGALRLHVIRGGRAGVELVLGAGPQAGNTDARPSDWGNACGDGSDAADDTYFLVACPGAHTVDADTCDQTEDFDSILAVYDADGNELGCDDDSCGVAGHASHVLVDITGPGLYWLVVDGYGAGNSGPYDLAYTW